MTEGPPGDDRDRSTEARSPIGDGGAPEDVAGAEDVEGAGGARRDAVGTEAERAVTGDSPLEAAAGADGVVGSVRAWIRAMTPEERGVSGLLIGLAAVLLLSVAVGLIRPDFLLSVLSLTGMYILLSMGLNVQWGYTGLINFSVAAFFGVGAYTAALLASADSPLTGGTVPVLSEPVVGIFAAVAVAAVVAALIGIPTLSLRDDYLAIASLGLAEVIRILIKNEQAVTGGVQGVLGMPRFLEGWPVLGDLAGAIPEQLFNTITVVVFVLVTWWALRRAHRSPWGRAQRLVRSDEDVAAALGKDTFRLRMQSWVVGSAVMALAGVFFVHLNNSLFPGSMEPIRTFYVWIAVILGGTGSDRGAILGGVVIVTILRATQEIASLVPGVDAGPLRLLLVGLVIIGVMALRPQGVLPPQRELIWRGADGRGSDE